MIHSYDVPSLEYLINQCCEERDTNLGETDTETQQKERGYYNTEAFKQFIVDLHCQENLKFLVDICHYEKSWNKVFKRKYSILKCKDYASSDGNTTAETNKGDFMREDRGISNPSMVSDNYDLDSADIEDLKTELHLTNNELSKNWDSLFKKSFEEAAVLKERELYGQEKGCLCQPPDAIHEDLNNRKIQDYLLTQLTLKFSEIIENFIEINSPYEINLPTDIYDAIMKDFNDSKILYHSPLIFLSGKNHTLQILRENIYFKFLKYEQRELEKESKTLKHHHQSQTSSILPRCEDCDNCSTSPLDSAKENDQVDSFSNISQTPTPTITIPSRSRSNRPPIDSPYPQKPKLMSSPISSHLMNNDNSSSPSTTTTASGHSSSHPSTSSTFAKQHITFHNRRSSAASPDLTTGERSNSNESQTSLNSTESKSGADKIWKKFMKFKIGK